MTSSSRATRSRSRRTQSRPSRLVTRLAAAPTSSAVPHRGGIRRTSPSTSEAPLVILGQAPGSTTFARTAAAAKSRAHGDPAPRSAGRRPRTARARTSPTTRPRASSAPSAGHGTPAWPRSSSFNPPRRRRQHRRQRRQCHRSATRTPRAAATCARRAANRSSRRASVRPTFALLEPLRLSPY